MEQIFISSLARGEMGAIREAARRAVEALDMHPVMFETGAASDEGSRRTLLDRVSSCDAVVLLLGDQYGEAGHRGMSPTEEEFNEARERGIPVLALVQNTTREPAQEEFLSRVRGNWEKGRLTADFTDAGDVGFAVTKALNAWRRQGEGGDAAPAAEARALEVARGDQRPGSFYGGSKLRVVAAPATDRPLLDAVALRDRELLDDLASAARSSRLAPQSAAAERARDVIARSMAFVERVWQRIDRRDEVRDVFVACAVPEAEHKVYALEPIGNSMSMPMSMPHVLVAPDPSLRTRRADLPRVVERLEAELHRAFEIERAVHPRPDDRRGGSW